MSFFEIACEAHNCAATIYVVGLFGEIVASRIERWVASLPDHIVNRLDLLGVSYIDPVSFVRVARALTRWARRTRSNGFTACEHGVPRTLSSALHADPATGASRLVPTRRRVAPYRLELSGVARLRLEMQTARRRVRDGKHPSERFLFAVAERAQQRLQSRHRIDARDHAIRWWLSTFRFRRGQFRYERRQRLPSACAS